MIEFPITLTSGGSVCLPGHASALALGYAKNKSVYRLAVTATGEWAGLTIRAFWHVPGGSDPASTLVVDGYVAVPASVTAQPGNGCITFEGSDGTRTVTSADLRYRVSANSGTEDGSMPEPGTPAWQELVGAVHTDATAAEQAKTDAQTAAQQAGASAEKAGKALSDTITAKEDALKALGDKQTTATQAVDMARDKALQQVKASTKAAQTAASEAATSADKAAGSEKAAGDAQAKAAESLQELKEGIASGNFKGEPGTSPTVTVQDITGGHRIVITDATGTSSVDVMDGKDGAPGKDATVDDTLSQSGKAADAKVTGDELARKAVIDDTTVGTDSWSSKHIVDMFCPPLEESGNPVTCYPVVGSKLGVKASWEPTQEGSGEPSPENVRPIHGRDSVQVERCGENLLDVARIFPDKETYDATTFTNNKDGTITVDGITTRTAYFNSLNTFFLPAGTYTICAMSNTRMSVLRTSDRATLAASQVGEFRTFTLAKNEVCDCFIACDGTFSNEVIRPCIVQGVVDTGWTQFHGDIYDLTLPRTIYGGTVDAVSGESSRTWRTITLTGEERAHIYSIFFYLDLSEDSSFVIEKPADGKTGKSSHYPYAVYRDNCIGFTADGESLTYASNGKYPLSDEGLQQWKSYLAAQYAAGTPVQIAYKLATPTPITATGAQPIPALSGVNTVLTDADSATVTGRADPIKRITDLEDAVASMTNT